MCHLRDSLMKPRGEFNCAVTGAGIGAAMFHVKHPAKAQPVADDPPMIRQ
jgi:hypothetical protein